MKPIAITSATIVAVLLSRALIVGQSSSQPAANPFPRAQAADTGVSEAALRDLASRVRTWVEQEDAVGAELLVVSKRKTVLHEAYGLQDLDDRTPQGLNTIACIRSMTKPIVGTAVQMLVDEGRIGLDDVVSKYLPSFAQPKSASVTVRQLLTHTAGFPLTIINQPLSAYKSQREVSDRAGTLGPSLPPGVFNYSDTDTEILASIVGVVSGMPPEDFIQKRILDPLEMKDTYAVLRPGAPDRSRVSSNHAGYAATWHKYWDNEDAPLFPFFLGAASMYSTTVDYARFLAMWMDGGTVGGKRLLSEAAVRRALEPAVPMMMPDGKAPYPTRFPLPIAPHYAQHWIVFPAIPAAKRAIPVFSHTGSDGTGAWAFPDRDLMVLLFTQSRGGLPAIRVERFIAPLAGLEVEPAPVLTAQSPERTAPMLGSYTGPPGRAYVVRQHTRLAIQFETGLAVLRRPNPEGRYPFDGLSEGQSLEFNRGPDGRVTGFDLFTGSAAVAHFARETPATDLPSSDAFAALRHEKQGGDAVDRLTRLHLIGTVTAGSASGTIDNVSYPDGRLSAVVKVGGVEERTEIDASAARRHHSTAGDSMLTGAFLEQVRQGLPFARILDWRRTFRQVEVVRRDTVDGREVWVVRVTGAELPPSTRFVSVDTGLLLREDTWIAIRGVGVIPMTIAYSDYREVSGVLLPFHVETSSALTGKQVTQYTTIRTGPE